MESLSYRVKVKENVIKLKSHLCDEMLSVYKN